MNQNICFNCGGHFVACKDKTFCACCGVHRPENISRKESRLLTSAYQKLRSADFFEAERAFDDVICNYPKNTQGYWGRLLARYGVRYEESYDASRIPVCYAASIESVYDSPDYKKAMLYADRETQAVFREHAEHIERARKEHVEKASKEPPYDIFISYKESDRENGIKRTQDSDSMQELYTLLTGKGYRVFFSRESLRDKTGEKHEPYIFHAISTAKFMLIYGSKPEYMNAVWVKNEWARYLRRMRAGEKKTDSLLVAYEGFDPAELPDVLAALPSLDAGKKQFFPALLKAIKKALNEKTHCDEVSVGLEYRVNTNKKTCTVTGMGTCADTDLIIPDIIDGYRVTGILESAFDDCASLTSVTVSGSVIHIEGGAFSRCNALTSVIIPDSVTVIGENVFWGCSRLSSVCYTGTQEQWDRIALSDHWKDNSAIQGIQYCADGRLEKKNSTVSNAVIQKPLSSEPKNSVGLKYEVNPDKKTCTVTGMGSYRDENLMIPETLEGYWVTKIGRNAFHDRKLLKTVVIPNSVSTIENGAFRGCKNLASVIIPSSVTDVGSEAFCGCTALAGVVIPPSMIKISYRMFSDCASLATVFIPTTVSAIEKSAFSDCTSLEKLEIPASMASIGESAFRGCTALSRVWIPDSVSIIGENAFAGCAKLSGIHYTGSKSQWKQILLGNGWDDGTQIRKIQYNAEMQTPSAGSYGLKCAVKKDGLTCTVRSMGICQDTNVVIPSAIYGYRVTGIDEGAFYGCKTLESVEIPDFITSIGAGAFSDCPSITNIVIPRSVTSINDRTFAGCSALESVEIPDTVTSIGESAFSECASLNTLVIPDSVKSIGDEVFDACAKLTTILYTGTKRQWKNVSLNKNWCKGSSLTKIKCKLGTVKLKS